MFASGLLAQEAAKHMRKGAFFLDLNSASPATKQQAATAVDAAGAHCVEAVNTVREAGFAPCMAEASADKQQWVAQRARAGVFNGIGKEARWQDYADRLLDDRRRSDKNDAS